MPNKTKNQRAASVGRAAAHRQFPQAVFWTDDLEFPSPHIARDFSNDEQRQQWVERLTARQLEILCAAFSIINVPPRQRKAAVLAVGEQLEPFFLAHAFGRSVHKHAVRDVAKLVLPPAAVAGCLVNEDEDRYDKTSLLFGLFNSDHNHLRTVFHIDKVQRHGFARMEILRPPAHPTMDFKTWFKRPVAEAILKAIDAERGDGMTSEMRDVVAWEDSSFIFIRRGCGQGHVLNDTGRVVHGYMPEWIVLHFNRWADRVRISSKSISVPLIMANQLASAYYVQAVTYDNQAEKTYKAQIEHFMGAMVTATPAAVTLLEASVNYSPLRGGSKLRLGSASSSSLRESLIHFDQAIAGGVFRDIAVIEGIKVGFRNKRLSMRFDQEAGEPNEFVVRYSEHRLSMTERTSFEEQMQETYGITAISTERRFVNSPN